MVAQAACVVGAWNEAVAERVHLAERAGLARVGEVVGIAATGERRAARGLYRDEARGWPCTCKLVAHERGDEPAQVRATACAPDDHIGVFAQLAKGLVTF